MAVHGGDGVIAIEHGIAFPVAGFATLQLMQMTVALWGARKRIAARRSAWPAVVAIMGAFLFAGLTVVALSSGHDYRRAVDLRARGVVAQARVVRQVEEGCGKAACTTGLYYSFVPKGLSRQVGGFVDEAHHGSGDNEEYDYAVTTGTIPVIYDPTDPAASMVYWRDSVQRAAASFRIDLLVWGGILLLLTVLEGIMLASAVGALADAAISPSD